MKRSKQREWEYRVKRIEYEIYESDLCSYGKEGWELVKIIEISRNMIGKSSTPAYQLIYKRENYERNTNKR